MNVITGRWWVESRKTCARAAWGKHHVGLCDLHDLSSLRLALFPTVRFVEITLLALSDLIKACGRYGDGAASAVMSSYEAFDEAVSEAVLELLAHSNTRVKRVAAMTVRIVWEPLT